MVFFLNYKKKKKKKKRKEKASSLVRNPCDEASNVFSILSREWK